MALEYFPVSRFVFYAMPLQQSWFKYLIIQSTQEEVSKVQEQKEGNVEDNEEIKVFNFH